mmetsp:Transcript_29103/g.73012  ORF Transcript_29103/g.73012 Transcript_29103/m.73012 type:complete len:292 (+) Transcript_29103:1048-1923(+)
MVASKEACESTSASSRNPTTIWLKKGSTVQRTKRRRQSHSSTSSIITGTEARKPASARANAWSLATTSSKTMQICSVQAVLSSQNHHEPYACAPGKGDGESSATSSRPACNPSTRAIISREVMSTATGRARLRVSRKSHMRQAVHGTGWKKSSFWLAITHPTAPSAPRARACCSALTKRHVDVDHDLAGKALVAAVRTDAPRPVFEVGRIRQRERRTHPEGLGRESERRRGEREAEELARARDDDQRRGGRTEGELEGHQREPAGCRPGPRHSRDYVEGRIKPNVEANTAS